jgi:hypothetical protein
MAWELEQDGSVVRTLPDLPVGGIDEHPLLRVEVTVTGLPAATLFVFRSRCVVGEGPTRRELPWSAPVVGFTGERPHRVSEAKWAVLV